METKKSQCPLHIGGGCQEILLIALMSEENFATQKMRQANSLAVRRTLLIAKNEAMI